MTEQLPLNTSPLPVKLRVEDYLLLDQAGALDAYAKTELIEGEILFMNAQHRRHMFVKSELAWRMRQSLEAIGSRLFVGVEGSIDLAGHSAPEPDIVLTSEPSGDGLIPLPSVALLVEVADTTLDNDLGRKARLYASHGVPEYWVADVEGRALHQLWRPGPDGYAERRETGFGAMVEAVTVEGLRIETDRL